MNDKAASSSTTGPSQTEAIPPFWRELIAEPIVGAPGQPPLRFCFGLSASVWSNPADKGQAVVRTIAQVAAADAAGVDSIWLSEDPDGWDAFAVLGALSRVTSRVRLGTAVVNSYMRHPNLIAASVASLDLLSSGRAFLGLGRGQTEWYERAFGMTTDRPVARLEETISLLRQWWTPPYRASGKSPIPVDDWPRIIGPWQAQPPIYLAAAGPLALKLGAKHADGIIFNSLTSDEFLAETIPQLRQTAERAGRDPATLAFILRTEAVVTDHPEQRYQGAKTTLAMINALPAMDRLLKSSEFDVPAIMGKVRQLMHTDQVLARGGAFVELRQAGDLDAARAAIPTEFVASLAIAGSVDHVRQRLTRLARLGITHVFLGLR